MRSRDEDKLSMYEKVNLFLKDHITDVQSIVSTAATAKSEFDSLLNELFVIIAQSGAQTTGYTQIKENARLQLENRLLRTLRVLRAFSIDTHLPDLEAKTDYSRSDIERLRDSDIYTTAMRIFELGATYVASLSGYSYNSGHLADLESSKNAFFEVIQLPKDKIGERSSYNKLIELKMADIDTLLRDKMDTYLSILEFDKPQLFDQYKSARSIDASRGTGSSKVYKGVVMAGLTAVVCSLTYDPDRTYTLSNKGKVGLTFGLSVNGTDIEGTTVTLQEGDEITRDASDLHSEGEYLLVQNTSSDEGSYEVEADV